MTHTVMNTHDTSSATPVIGRFAPSPSGRMHLGNMFTALISWLSVRSTGGRWILRIEDLDPQRSKAEHTRMIEDDLQWLGLDWDEGGSDDKGENGPYSQSRRHDIYSRYLHMLDDTGLTYSCSCTRADIMATQAPHQSDGRVIYQGTCRPHDIGTPEAAKRIHTTTLRAATRLYVPDRDIQFTDRVFGTHNVNPASNCGDFVLQRADGAWAYQLAVVVDDALMGVTEVVRGCDLLLSTAQQIYLYELLNLPVPQFAHLPLICNTSGQRLAKRDLTLNMEQLRRRHTPESLTGLLACMAGIIDRPKPLRATDLIGLFDWNSVPRTPAIQISAD